MIIGSQVFHSFKSLSLKILAKCVLSVNMVIFVKPPRVFLTSISTVPELYLIS